MIWDLKLECARRLSEIANKKAVLITYLKNREGECDWHGVSDAANDIRDLEAKEELLVELISLTPTAQGSAPQ